MDNERTPHSVSQLLSSFWDTSQIPATFLLQSASSLDWNATPSNILLTRPYRYTHHMTRASIASSCRVGRVHTIACHLRISSCSSYYPDPTNECNTRKILAVVHAPRKQTNSKAHNPLITCSLPTPKYDNQGTKPNTSSPTLVPRGLQAHHHRPSGTVPSTD